MGRDPPWAPASCHAFSARAGCRRWTVVLRKAYGGGFITMNSRQLGADVVLAWPGAEIGVLGRPARRWGSSTRRADRGARLTRSGSATGSRRSTRPAT